MTNTAHQCPTKFKVPTKSLTSLAASFCELKTSQGIFFFIAFTNAKKEAAELDLFFLNIQKKIIIRKKKNCFPCSSCRIKKSQQI